MGAPDFGETMWKAGHRGRVIALNILPPVSIANYGDIRELTGFIETDVDRLCITVATKQTTPDLAKLIRSGSTGVNGILDAEAVIGGSGEQYRMVRGTVICVTNLMPTE